MGGSSELAIRVEGTRLAKRAERASLSGRMGELGLTITPLGETPFPPKGKPVLSALQAEVQWG